MKNKLKNINKPQEYSRKVDIEYVVLKKKYYQLKSKYNELEEIYKEIQDDYTYLLDEKNLAKEQLEELKLLVETKEATKDEENNKNEVIEILNIRIYYY